MKSISSSRGLWTLLFAVAVFGQAVSSRAQLYTFTDLGTIYGKHSYGSAIGSSGVVTGAAGNQFNTDAHGFAEFGGQQVDLGTFGGKQTFGSGVNSFGLIVGGSELPSGRPHGFFYRLGPGKTDLGTLPGGDTSWAYCVNDKLQIGGTANVSSGSYHAVLWSLTNGIKITDLDPQGTNSQVIGINAAGEAAGYWTDPMGNTHAVVWSGGNRIDLGNLGLPYAAAYGVNNKGQVIGQANMPNFGVSLVTLSSFIWDKVNGMKAVASLPGGVDSSLYAINNLGDAVGFSQDFAQDNHAVLYHNGSLVDLNDLVDPNLDWTLTVAAGINDHGEIVGEGTRGQVKHAFKLTPIVVQSISILPGTVNGGATVQVTVLLNSPAPKDLAVHLVSNNGALPVPALIGISKGTQKLTLKVKTNGVISPQSATVTATYGGKSVSSKVDILP